jgi:Inner membrane protein import complex subunit Tim54
MRKQILERRKQQTLPVDQRANTRQAEGGDVIIIGRNTFKETVRGIQEGYLLPLDYTPPQEPQPEPVENPDDTKPLPSPEKDILPAIPESEYASLPDPEDGPGWTFTYVPSTHILGVRHTPRRIFRFLTRRYQAEEICAQIVAALLQQSEREWREDDTQRGATEERFWPKTVAREAEWREDLVVDPRIRPRFRWRTYQPVVPVPEWRESSEPTYVGKVEELVPTEEERIRDERIREEAEQAKRVAMQRRSSFYPGLNLFGRDEPRS